MNGWMRLVYPMVRRREEDEAYVLNPECTADNVTSLRPPRSPHVVQFLLSNCRLTTSTLKVHIPKALPRLFPLTLFAYFPFALEILDVKGIHAEHNVGRAERRGQGMVTPCCRGRRETFAIVFGMGNCMCMRRGLLKEEHTARFELLVFSKGKPGFRNI